MAKNKERKLAEELYINSDLSQKEIAEQLGLAEKTISEWKDKYGWDNLRAARRVTRSEMINKLYASMNKIIDDAQDTKKPMSAADADKIHKLGATIEKLEGGDTLSNSIQALSAFYQWLKDVDLDAAKQLTKYSKEYLYIKAKG